MEGHLFQFSILLGVLGLAAAMSLALRLPVVPLYITTGLLLGTSGLIRADEVVTFLGSLGVVFLLFSMGLEFSVGSLTREAGRFLRPGSIDFLANFPVGLVAGRLLGWSWTESLFLAGILYMSSSAVVAKCVADFGRAARPETETLLRVMVFEDLVIAVFLVLMNAVLAGAAEQSGHLFRFASPLIFLAVLFLLARRYQEPLARVIAARSEESFTLAVFAFVVFVASTAALLGLSDAVGAFLAGLVIGATNLKQRAADTLRPFQTVFAALFFVSFGMSLEFANLGSVLLPAIVLVGLGIITKTLGGFLGGRAARHNPRQSLVMGLSLVPKGEFSIVIAALAAELSGPDSGIVGLTGLYVLALSIIGPIGMRFADPLRDLVFALRPARH